MSRLSDTAAFADPGDGDPQVLFDSAAVTWTRRALAIVQRIAEESRYEGGWGIAGAATRVRGLPSDATKWMHDTAGRIDVETWEGFVSASYGDLVERPGTLAGRLLRGLLHPLGTDSLYPEQLSNPETADDDG